MRTFILRVWEDNMSKTQPRVALFLAPGVEECEALVIYDLLFRASIACDKVAVLSLIHISEPTRQDRPSRMPSSA